MLDKCEGLCGTCHHNYAQTCSMTSEDVDWEEGTYDDGLENMEVVDCDSYIRAEITKWELPGHLFALIALLIVNPSFLGWHSATWIIWAFVGLFQIGFLLSAIRYLYGNKK